MFHFIVLQFNLKHYQFITSRYTLTLYTHSREKPNPGVYTITKGQRYEQNKNICMVSLE